MSESITLLVITAATIGFVHTLLGPDHYLPFVLMGRAGRWSKTRTLVVTGLCGIGHVLGSVLLGAAAIVFGIALSRVELIESTRGDLAAWLLIGFGVAYAAWGLRRAWRDRPHRHLHRHADGTVHDHDHGHHGEHAHAHGAEAKSLTPWVLFTIFVLGPCEPLVPLLMVPAAQESFGGVVLVTAVFGFTTLVTMLAAVAVVLFGVERLPLGPLERYSHALAGAALVACGLAIQFLGL